MRHPQRIDGVTRIFRFFLLVLLSGAGLLAFGVYNLWTALDEADERARLEVQRAALLTARSLRLALLDPVLLDKVAAEHQFTASGQSLTIPTAVGWVTPATEQPDLDVSTPIRNKLNDAKQLEVRDGDPLAARTMLTGIYADPSLLPRQKGWVGITLAWHAHRANDLAVRDALLDELDVAIEASLEGAYRTTVASVILLDVVSGRPLAPWASEAFVFLSESESRGVIQRLRERGRVDEANSLELCYAPIARQRHVLRTAGRRLAALLAEDRPSVSVVDSELVLFYPGEAGAGRGAVLDVEQAIAFLKGRLEDAAEHSGVLVEGALDSASPVVEGFGVGVVPDYPVIEKSGAVGLWSALIALAICFVLGMFMTVRVMRREAEAMRARTDFLTSVTHELKTPLASLRLLSERLVEGRVRGAKLEQYYGFIASESSRLTVLIENVLDLGRMERGERSYDMRVLPLSEIVHEAAQLFSPLAQADGFEFKVEVGDESACAEVDRSAVVQAIVNVLENARKYARDGKSVEIHSSIADGMHHVVVRDHGPGVAIPEQQRIFEQFERGNRQKDGSVPGVGLGLYLARSIMQAHGGDLSCSDPETGLGAAFHFTLPLHTAS